MPLSIAHAKSDTVADMTGTVTGHNSAGATTTMLATALVRPSDWNSQHNTTLSLTGAEIASLFTFAAGLTSSSNASGLVVGIDDGQYYEPFPLPNTNSTLSVPGIGTWYFDGPYYIPSGLGMGLHMVLVTNVAGFLHGTTFSAATTGSVTRYQTFYNMLAMYKQGTGASTSRLELVCGDTASIMATWVRQVTSTATSHVRITNALTLSFGSGFDVTGGETYGSTSQSGSTESAVSTVASTFANNLITGAVAYVSGSRADLIGMPMTIPPGNYWMAHCFSSSSSSIGTNYSQGTMFSSHGRLGLLENAMGAFKRIGQSVSNSTTNVEPFHGYLATTASSATSIVNTSDIRATTGRMYWNYFATTY